MSWFYFLLVALWVISATSIVVGMTLWPLPVVLRMLSRRRELRRCLAGGWCERFMNDLKAYEVERGRAAGDRRRRD